MEKAVADWLADGLPGRAAKTVDVSRDVLRPSSPRCGRRAVAAPVVTGTSNAGPLSPIRSPSGAPRPAELGRRSGFRVDARLHLVQNVPRRDHHQPEEHGIRHSDHGVNEADNLVAYITLRPRRLASVPGICAPRVQRDRSPKLSPR